MSSPGEVELEYLKIDIRESRRHELRSVQQGLYLLLQDTWHLVRPSWPYGADGLMFVT